MQTTQTSKPPTQYYTWKNYRCAYELHHSDSSHGVPLLLIHPIGVGLSRKFWERFCREWYLSDKQNQIYNPDLLGCGDSDLPHVAYSPEDWAEQLEHFLQTVVQKPVIVIVQGALMPVAIALVQRTPTLIRGLIFAGPPAWTLISQESADFQHKLIWNILDSPLGNAFYRYARRQEFLRSFSVRQLFDKSDAVDSEWLDTLVEGASHPASRHAVFSFLAGFWRQNYSQAMAAIQQPTLVVMGETASSISAKGKRETPDERLADYLAALPHGRGVKVAGRNVLPYESTTAFVDAIATFVKEVSS
jgi:pimeloyl-ACP methyl ester carboxylesterase